MTKCFCGKEMKKVGTRYHCSECNADYLPTKELIELAQKIKINGSMAKHGKAAD